jgi:hypothetical protein
MLTRESVKYAYNGIPRNLNIFPFQTNLCLTQILISRQKLKKLGKNPKTSQKVAEIIMENLQLSCTFPFHTTAHVESKTYLYIHSSLLLKSA